jgi:hypothetical protein
MIGFKHIFFDVEDSLARLSKRKDKHPVRVKHGRYILYATPNQYGRHAILLAQKLFGVKNVHLISAAPEGGVREISDALGWEVPSSNIFGVESVFEDFEKLVVAETGISSAVFIGSQKSHYIKEKLKFLNVDSEDNLCF